MAVVEKRVVIPADMGKTIEFGSAEADKWNVKVDGTTLIRKTDGSLAVAPAGCHRITNMNRMTGLPSGDGIYCIYGEQTPQAPLVGAPVDAGSTKETQRRLAASTATTQNYDWNGIAIRADGQLLVYLNGGSTTWMSTNDEADERESGWSDWRHVENMPAAPTSNGLDCAAIAALPKKAWAKGTTVLARGADGACHQLTALDSIFQEVGVGITASKLYGLTGEKYHVVVTVTNTGEGTNDRTDLTITKPALGNYTTTNFTTSKAGATAITRGADDFVYTITGLTKGGTAKVEFDVTPNSMGTFQFQASINPNSALDQQSNNNTATVTLSATTNTAPNYTPSVECPYVTAKIGDRNLFVTVDKKPYYGNGFYGIGTSASVRNNILLQESLRGVTVDFTNGSTFVVFAELEKNGTWREPGSDTVVLSNGRYVISSRNEPRRLEPTDSMSGAYSVNYSLNNNSITFNDDFANAKIFVRPSGANCVWQAVVLATTRPVPKTLTLDVTGDPVQSVKVEEYNRKEIDGHGQQMGWNLPAGVSQQTRVFEREYVDFGKVDRLEVRIPRNTAKTFSVLATGSESMNYFVSSRSTGRVEVAPEDVQGNGYSKLNITVAANAQPTDSIVFKNVKIIIE